jgi:hypothetical protein
MKLSTDAWIRIQRIYQTLHAALWAVLLAAVATMIIGIPRMLEARANAEYRRAQEISDESRVFCGKWGMSAGTVRYVQCERDLQEIRAREDQRLAGDFDF